MGRDLNVNFSLKCSLQSPVVRTLESSVLSLGLLLHLTDLVSKLKLNLGDQLLNLQTEIILSYVISITGNSIFNIKYTNLPKTQ